ncbi:MAG: hypothetical protein AMK69_09845 [Nitrospira bacterium SG8_3]|nr:MAG: hypothetical protein AMK69_09845 [Nitrospira bacterium SG8_3]
MRLPENAHLPFGRPFDKLTVLSKVEGLTALSKVDPSTKLRVDAELCRSIEGLRYPHPSSLRRNYMYASLLGISEALQLDIFHQPLRRRFFDILGAAEIPQAFWPIHLGGVAMGTLYSVGY